MAQSQNEDDFVDVLVVEFPAHTAFLDPPTGTGYLVLPRPEADIEALTDPLVEAVWSGQLSNVDAPSHLSLHAADRQRVLGHLELIGWRPLRGEDGEVQVAGTTRDGRQVLCMLGLAAADLPPFEALSRAVTALDIAAGLDPRTIG